MNDDFVRLHAFPNIINFFHLHNANKAHNFLIYVIFSFCIISFLQQLIHVQDHHELFVSLHIDSASVGFNNKIGPNGKPLLQPRVLV